MFYIGGGAAVDSLHWRWLAKNLLRACVLFPATMLTPYVCVCVFYFRQCWFYFRQQEKAKGMLSMLKEQPLLPLSTFRRRKRTDSNEGTVRTLRLCYAVSGTRLGCRATHVDVRDSHQACYDKSGTDIGDGVVPGTE